MSKKIYKSAMGKTIDLGSLILQNENVRAVGNMGVNARGDLLDSSDRVIERKNAQLKKQYNRQTKTNVQDMPLHTSTKTAKMSKQAKESPQPEVSESVLPTPVTETQSATAPMSGLAGALSKASQSQ